MVKKKYTGSSCVGWAKVFAQQDEQLEKTLDKMLSDRQEVISNLKEAAEMFHKLWGQAASSNYNKKDWSEMQLFLQKIGVPV